MNIKKILATTLPLVAVLAPVAAGAVTFDQFVGQTLTGFINTTIKFLIALATLLFIIGVVRYIFAGGSAEKTEEARRFIIFAIVGLALIVVIWGVVNIVVSSLGTDNTAPTNTYHF